MYRHPFEIDAAELMLDREPAANEYLVLRNGSKSVLAAYDIRRQRLRAVSNKACSGIQPRNAEQSFALDALMNRDLPLVTISGKAGTGKNPAGPGRRT